MSRFIEYSNNILFFDVMFGETLNEETRCSKCVHPFLRMQYTILRQFLPKDWNYIHLKTIHLYYFNLKKQR